MIKFFNVYFQFNHESFEELVEVTAKTGKGYCCFIDATSLAFSIKNENFRDVLNNSIANSCDGSYIALLASKLHKTKLREYIGPDFFEKYIHKPDKHIILGNTQDVFNKIKAKVSFQNNASLNLNFIEIPYCNVEDFNYFDIAQRINELQPNYIWVSLGAPKQEFFMAHLLPHINKGVMLGVGAALNYFTGQIKEIPQWVRKSHLIWFFRILTEPKKQLRRCFEIITIIPKMYNEEKRIQNNI